MRRSRPPAVSVAAGSVWQDVSLRCKTMFRVGLEPTATLFIVVLSPGRPFVSAIVVPAPPVVTTLETAAFSPRRPPAVAVVAGTVSLSFSGSRAAVSIAPFARPGSVSPVAVVSSVAIISSSIAVSVAVATAVSLATSAVAAPSVGLVPRLSVIASANHDVARLCVALLGNSREVVGAVE